MIRTLLNKESMTFPSISPDRKVIYNNYHSNYSKLIIDFGYLKEKSQGASAQIPRIRFVREVGGAPQGISKRS